MKIKTNITKAKAIAHDMRRAKRGEDFAPLDVQATIPAKQVEAEAARQVIRDNDDKLQTSIDSATTEKALKKDLVKAGLI